MGYLGRDILTDMCNQHIGRLYLQMSKRHGDCPILKIRVIGVLTIFGLVRKVIGK